MLQQARAQQNDTAVYPYWIAMMQNPSVNFYKTQRAFELYWAGRTIEKSSGWKVFKRWEWLASKLVDSLGNFPDAGLLATDLEDKIRQDNNYWQSIVPGLGPGTVPCKTQGDWKEIGPVQIPANNTGQINGMGRINAVALHPADSNTIFVGAAAGGIWKSTNGGQTWSVNTDVLPTLGVSAIAITPSNPSVMYFGSGDRDASDAAGFGVFKSSNGGSSWASSNTGMGNRTVSRLIIDPNNANILLAACNGGIYRSVNAGSTWTQTFSGGFFKDIVFKPGNSNYVYASNGGQFYRSTDNGINWTNITTGLPTTSVSRISIDVNPLDHKLVYLWIANGSVNRGFYLSRDSGTSFRTQSTSPNIHDYSTNGSGTGGQAWYNMDMVTDPSNAGIVYCGGVNVFRSNDTGKTWTIAGYWVNQIHADQHELVASPITGRIYAANDGGLYTTRNRGVSWTPLKSGLAVAQIYKLDASRLQKDILINGYQDNGTANYSNGGWYTTRGGDGMDCEVDQTDPRYSYGELYYGSVFRIFNVNTQATIAQQGYTAAGSDTINESGGWVTPITLKEGSGNTMYIGYKNIWRSNNIRANPVTWKRISYNLGGTNASNFTEIESCIANPDILYASRSNGTLWRSDNVNATSPTWTAITQPVAGVVNAIETDPKNQNVVYIGIGTRVYRSTNKGGSWSQINSNHTYNVSSILLDTSSSTKSIYVGTMGGGIWYTDSTLSAWRYFANGLPNTVRVTDLEMYYEPRKDCKCNVLYASTYNRGNWNSTIYNDGTQKPVALLDAYDTVICKSSTITFKDRSCNSPGRFKWAFSPAGAVFTGGSDTMSQNPTLSFGSPGRYTFKFMAENCNGIDTLEGYVLVGDSVKSACVPSTTNNVNGLGIYSVQMANISRSSEGRTTEGAYVNLACSRVFKVKKGKAYALRVTTGSLNTEQVKAFIDFNNNGSLTDAGELVYQPAAGLPNHMDSVRIPLNAVSGRILRMRIRSDFSSIGTNPCSNLSYGQTEDYGLYIEEDNFTPRFVSSSTALCSGTTVWYTDSTNYNGLTYTWNFGSGAVPATATGKGPHRVRYNLAGYKRVSLSIDGKTTSRDSAVLVHLSPRAGMAFSMNDSSVCQGEAFAFAATDSAASGASWQWYLNGTAISDSVFSTFGRTQSAIADSGRYSVRAYTANCADTAFANLHIRPVPQVSFSINDSTQCLRGNNFSFGFTGSIRSGSMLQRWDFGNGSSDTGNTVVYTYNTPGVYQVKLLSVSNFACRDSVSKPLEVYVHPQAAFALSPQAQCFENNRFGISNLSSIANGSYSSSWDFGNGNGYAGANPPALSYAAYDSIYNIKLLLISNRGCRDSLIRQARLYPMPQPGFGINDTAQCFKNNRFVLSDSSGIAAGTYTVSWDFGDGSTSTLGAPVHRYGLFGTYQMRQNLISNFGCTASVSRPVQVYEQAALGFGLNDSSQCQKGNDFVFSNFSSIGSGVLQYLWQFGDGSSDTAAQPRKTYSAAGNYTVSLSSVSAFFCRDTITLPLQVFHQTAADFNISPTVQCYTNNRFTLSNVSMNPGGPFSCNWNFGDGSSSGSASPAPKSYAAFSDSLQVHLYTLSINGCRDTASRTLYMLPSPYAGFSTTDSSLCLKGNAFVFTGTGSTDQGPYSTRWRFGDATSDTTANAVHRYGAAGTYLVKQILSTPGGCLDSAVKTVRVWPNTLASFTIDNPAQCRKGNRFAFTENGSIGSGSYTAAWNFGDGNTGSGNVAAHSYSNHGNYNAGLFLLSDKGCRDTLYKSVRVYESPRAAFALSDTQRCLSGNVFRYTDISTSGAAYTRSWYVPALSASTAGSNTVSFSDTGYRLLALHIRTADNCADTAYKRIFVAPSPVFDIDGRRSVCLNDTLRLWASYRSGQTYSWQLDGRSAGTGNTLDVSGLSTGKHLVEVLGSNSYGCSTRMQYPDRVEVLPLPVIDFTFSKIPLASGARLIFTDMGGNKTLSRNWSFSNGLSGSGPSYDMFISDTLTLKATLSITDSNFCRNSGSKTWFISIPNAYFVPTVFTPNEDGLNDVFKIGGYLSFRTYSMSIYNRWGELIFESTDPNQGWDGRFGGETVMNGEYIYLISFEDADRNKVKRKGTVLLQR